MPIEFIPAAGACLVSNNVLSGAGRIKWMVREESRAAAYNGWRIFSDIDTTEYLHDASNLAITDFNSVCELEPAPSASGPPRRLRPADRRRRQRHRDRRHCHRSTGPRRPALRPRELDTSTDDLGGDPQKPYPFRRSPAIGPPQPACARTSRRLPANNPIPPSRRSPTRSSPADAPSGTWPTTTTSVAHRGRHGRLPPVPRFADARAADAIGPGREEHRAARPAVRSTITRPAPRHLGPGCRRHEATAVTSEGLRRAQLQDPPSPPEPPLDQVAAAPRPVHPAS